MGDREPEGPFTRPKDEPPAEVKGMSGFGALWWSIAVTFLFLVLFLTFGKVEVLGSSVLPATLTQVVGYGIGLAAILRLYAPSSPARAILALRGCGVGVLLLAPVLGVALSVACSFVHELILDRFPSADRGQISQEWSDAATPSRALILLAVVLIGPFIEELVFRGALFTLVKRYAATALPFSVAVIARRALAAAEGEQPKDPPLPRDPWDSTTIMATSLGFVLIHMEPRTFIPISIAAAGLGILRARTQSLWPSLLCHMGFNAAPFALNHLTADSLERVPLTWAIGAGVVALGLLALVARWTRDVVLRDEVLT